MSKRIEIMFCDFKEQMQKELLEAHHVTSPDEMNWDVLPITVLYVEADEDEEDS